jgi:hypothetical protein
VDADAGARSLLRPLARTWRDSPGRSTVAPMDRQTVSLLGIVIFCALALGSRALGERALAGLSANEKVRLLDGFSRHRIYLLIPVMGLTVLILLASQRMPEHAVEIATAHIALTLALIVGINVVVLRKLRSLSLPEAYLRRFLVARALTFVGLLILLGAMAYTSLPAR